MQTTSLLFLATAAIASPLLARTGGGQWGSCATDCQYTCTAVGLFNLASCVSALNGNTIIISLGNLIPKDLESRCEIGCSHGGDATCCTANGLLNLLTCVDLLNGNTISVPLLNVIGL
jgi:hypothetical protein